MTSEFDMPKVNIPYGILHDSYLTGVKCENNYMTFSFNIEIYPEDYTDSFYKQYEKFKHCDMIVEMSKEPWNSFLFETGVNKRGKFKGLCLNRADFLNIINDAFRVTFVKCSATYREFKIELSIDLHNFKGNRRKYKKYDMCYITLDASKVSWNWY